MSTDTSLMDQIRERIESKKVTLPAMSSVASQLIAVVNDEFCTMDQVVELVSADQSLSSALLRQANSSYYGGLTEIKTLSDAAIRLGTAETVRIAVAVTEKTKYQVRLPELEPFINPLWLHAITTARGAQWLAKKLGYQDLENEAYIAGLLHDVGKLLLVRVVDDLAADDGLQGGSEALIEEIMGSAHTVEGYRLAQEWGLPEAYAMVIRDHHENDLSSKGTLINLVSLVDKACSKMGTGLKHDSSIVLEATDEAYTLGAGDILLAELAIMLEDSLETTAY